MVVQQKLNELRGRPHEDKKAVASGVAVAVVIVLIIVWGFLFLRKMKRTDLSLQNTAIPADQFNLNLIRDTERDQALYDPTEDIRNLRETSAQGQIDATSAGSGVSPYGEAEGDFSTQGGF